MQDKSFTGTLFMKHEEFEKMATKDEAIAFFRENFPDALAQIGPDRVIKDFFENPIGSLVTMRVLIGSFADETNIQLYV